MGVRQLPGFLQRTRCTFSEFRRVPICRQLVFETLIFRLSEELDENGCIPGVAEWEENMQHKVAWKMWQRFLILSGSKPLPGRYPPRQECIGFVRRLLFVVKRISIILVGQEAFQTLQRKACLCHRGRDMEASSISPEAYPKAKLREHDL